MLASAVPVKLPVTIAVESPVPRKGTASLTAATFASAITLAKETLVSRLNLGNFAMMRIPTIDRPFVQPDSALCSYRRELGIVLTVRSHHGLSSFG